MMSLLSLPIVTAALIPVASASSPALQGLKGRTDHGHRSVFSVEVTYADGAKRKETMADMSTGGTEFVLLGKDPQGGEHQMWLDTVADIDVIRPEAIRVKLKDGKTMDLTQESYYAIHTASPDGGSAEVRFENVKHVHFLRPVRRDGLGNAIFDGWSFSPFTGKRVP